MRYSELDLNALEVIKANCSKIYHSSVRLNRAVGLFNGNSFIKNIRADRKPRDSSKLHARIFNLYMELNDFPFRKENTLSVAINEDVAANYGDYFYKIFPFDDAQYLYSTTIEDFYTIPEKIEDDFLFDAEQNKGNMPISLPLQVKVKGVTDVPEQVLIDYIKINEHKYRGMFSFKQTKDPNELREAKGEILVLGSKYVGIFYQ